MTESKDEIKKIWLDKIRKENEADMALVRRRAANPVMHPLAPVFERTKVLDQSYLDFGLKFHYVQYAVWHYKLDDDKDVKDLEASFAIQK